MKQENLDAAAAVLTELADAGTIVAASLHVRHRDQVFRESFGAADTPDSVFLLASITKPMAISAVMTLLDQGEFRLQDSVSKFIPEFKGDDRDKITIRQLMTHVSGLPDQLPENAGLRAGHAPLSQFVEKAIGTPLLFPPGSRYSYSSMGILLACEVAQRISGQSIRDLVHESVFDPLGMKHSALGVGDLDAESLMRCQVERAAAESGAGDSASKDWDWNSSYWRNLGSPWGGAHGSARDVATFLDAFLNPQGKQLRVQTARLMTRNHNPHGLRPRGLGFELGSRLASGAISESSFGHGGSTGTLCWADPETDTVFVILTTLPTTAMNPHPRMAVSALVAGAVG